VEQQTDCSGCEHGWIRAGCQEKAAHMITTKWKNAGLRFRLPGLFLGVNGSKSKWNSKPPLTKRFQFAVAVFGL